MTLASAFTAAASALGFIGLVVLVGAAVVTVAADLVGRDLVAARRDEARS